MSQLSDPKQPAPLWLLVARRYDGVRELLNGMLNQTVRDFFKHTGFPANKVTVTTPWCAAFASACLEKAGAQSTRSAAAISYEKFGRKCDPGRVGAILVFLRLDGGNPNARHVGFSEGYAPNGKLLIRAGNQRNMVCVVERSPIELTAARWPIGPDGKEL